jgi:hypothetical protein
VTYILTAMLVMTTPVGTGEGVHEDQILHPILPHVHTLNGQIISHDQADAIAATASRPPLPSSPTGTALGAGTGADAAGLGIALQPTVPQATLLPPMSLEWGHA